MKKHMMIAVVLLLTCSNFISCKKEDVQQKETIVYETNFNSNDGNWRSETTEPGVTLQFKDGYYQISKTTAGSYYVHAWELFNNITGNTAIEASIALTNINAGTSTIYSAGLEWNGNETTQSGFAFRIFTNGKFHVGGWPDGNTYVSYKDATVSNAIRNGFNVLRIELRSGRLHFLINGAEVYSMPPVNDASLDRAGFSIGQNLILRADYFKALRLP